MSARPLRIAHRPLASNDDRFSCTPAFVVFLVLVGFWALAAVVAIHWDKLIGWANAAAESVLGLL